jgi:site-specific recombinase XerD
MKSVSPIPIAQNSNAQIAILPGPETRLLTRAEFQHLSEVPPEVEWFANIENPNTRRAYRNDLAGFMTFVGIQEATEFRSVSRAHIIAWRKELEKQSLAAATIRRKLSALSDLFDHLCESNAITHNPVKGVERPKEGSNEGKTPAISDGEARVLLDAPDGNTLKGKRDRAILGILLYHALRRAELCSLHVKDFHPRRGIMMLAVMGKGSKIRNIPVHPKVIGLIQDYLDFSGHGTDNEGPLFRPVKSNQRKLDVHITPNSIYEDVVLRYGKAVGIATPGFRPHALRSTAATNALENGSEIKKVKEWLGHSNISTTELYDKRQSRPEDSPTFKVKY